MIPVIAACPVRRRMGAAFPMPWHRRVALATLVLLGLLTVLPAAGALGHTDHRCCARGICCHRASPTDTECLRTACRCPAHGDASGILVVTPIPGVLVEHPPAFHLVRAGAVPALPRLPHAAWDPDAPDPPPQHRPLA